MNIKNRRFFLVSIISVLILFQSEVYARKANPTQGLDIVFIGNSITYGVSLKNPKKEAPPVIASDYIRNKSINGDVNFYNNGINGYTTVDFLPSGNAFADLIEATKKLYQDKGRLLIFSISLGTNDSAMEGTNGAPVSPENYFRNLQLIINQLLSNFPESKIILQQPIWYSANTQNNSRYLTEGLERLQSYFPHLKALAKYYSKINHGHVFLGDRKGFSYFSKNSSTDFTPENGKQGIFFLHPNKKGAVVLGTFWGKAIYRNVIK